MKVRQPRMTRLKYEIHDEWMCQCVGQTMRTHLHSALSSQNSIILIAILQGCGICNNRIQFGLQ